MRLRALGLAAVLVGLIVVALAAASALAPTIRDQAVRIIVVRRRLRTPKTCFARMWERLGQDARDSRSSWREPGRGGRTA